MDYFQSKNLKPMSIDNLSRPFDSDKYIYELKLNGIRCLAYLDETSTTLIDKHNVLLNDYFPELITIHAHVKCKCILDGVIIVLKRGVSDKAGIEKRTPRVGIPKGPILEKEFPASFIAFDMIYLNNKPLVTVPLMERKKLLEETVNDTLRLAASRYVLQHGISMFYLAKRNNLDGIIAKHINSLYYPATTTKEWINVLISAYHYYVVCGYYILDQDKVHIILGQYRDQELVFKGKIETNLDQDFLLKYPVKAAASSPFRLTPMSKLQIVWLFPTQVCEILITDEDTTKNSMKSFIQFIHEKSPKECIEGTKNDAK
ncbi:MAG: hypothetical protein ACK5JH_06200 [Anaerocolumna sp.]